MKRLAALTMLLGAGMGAAAHGSERLCFRTAAEAAAQSGVRDDDGFRLEAMRPDPLDGRAWALVRSCARPEMPAQWVLSGPPGASGLGRQRASLGKATLVQRASIAAAVLHAGSRVTLVLYDDAVRLEVEGIALAGGMVGDKVKVRILPASAEASERIAEGTIRGANLVEVEL
jgi:hypothetical protein